ncbi:hypothetical protein BC941DRAFT_354444 [Chlamydoabsidia padenii]|nr:hypothetical protein BC941DRAFT_354444 [Chlamydoabsidia padenii]
MYDRILNFLLFKVIVIGAVMDPVWRYILRLSLWVSILGFLQIFNLLCRDRFENLTMVSSAPHKVYHKITVLLCGLLLSNIIWYTGSMVLFPNYLTFLTLEFLPVTLDTLQVITKYWAHLLDQSWESGFERKWLINYYAEITADVLILGCTLIQYLHLMWIHGISLGMVDIILFFNVRSVLIVLHKKVLVHRERWRMESYVQRRYKDATDQELDAYDDDCAICRDPMKSAKKLSCGHIFHL